MTFRQLLTSLQNLSDAELDQEIRIVHRESGDVSRFDKIIKEENEAPYISSRWSNRIDDTIERLKGWLRGRISNVEAHIEAVHDLTKGRDVEEEVALHLCFMVYDHLKPSLRQAAKDMSAGIEIHRNDVINLIECGFVAGDGEMPDIVKEYLRPLKELNP